MIDIIYMALLMREQTEKTTFLCKDNYIYIGVGSGDLFIDEAHTVLGIFPVCFPCMLLTPLCGIFSLKFLAQKILFFCLSLFSLEKNFPSKESDWESFTELVINFK